MPKPHRTRPRVSMASAARDAAPAVTVAAPGPAPNCPSCDSLMILRNSARGQFYGCSKFPQCRGTRQVGEISEPVETPQLLVGSPEQEAIWAALLVDGSHLMVDAVAGSGKSTTIFQAILRMSRSLKIGVCAFNRHIAMDMNARLRRFGIQNATAITFNSLGNSALRSAYPNAQLESSKLLDLADEMFVAGSSEQKLNLIRLVSLIRGSLTDPDDPIALEDLMSHHGIDGDDILAAAPQMLALSYERRNSVIDFDDQLWITVKESLSVERFDVLFVDETQDLNRINQEMAFMACPTGRIVIVGDRHQAIYGWRGADVLSMDNFGQRLAATARGLTVMPLTLTRRCPRSHVKLAQALVPHICAMPNAPEGILRAALPMEKAVLEMQAGDMVLCRVNRFLVPVAYRLLRRGIRAVIRGRDVGTSIQSLIKKFRAKDIPELLKKLSKWHFQESAKLFALGRKGSSRLETLNDRCETLIELCEGLQSLDTLKTRIATLFADFDSDGRPAQAVILATIHGGKGLESSRIYLLAPELIPHPKATGDWQQVQERNCAYIAVTRAKFSDNAPGELIFVRGLEKSSGMIPPIYNYHKIESIESESPKETLIVTVPTPTPTAQPGRAKIVPKPTKHSSADDVPW